MTGLNELIGKLNDSLGEFKRQLVAEMMDKGWQPPQGWTDKDTAELGGGSTIEAVSVDELLTKLDRR